MALRVAVQDQRRLLREGLALALASEDDLEIVGAAATDRQLVELCANERPDVVVLELDASQWRVDALTRALRQDSRAVQVVGLYDRSREPSLANDHGAADHTVAREDGLAGLVETIRVAPTRDRRGRLRPSMGRSDRRDRVLTPREAEVLGLIALGLTSREVSARLGISPKTVENHKQRIFTKFGVQNQVHAVAIAMRCGLLRPASRDQQRAAV